MFRRKSQRTLKRRLGRVENQAGRIEPGTAGLQEERHQSPSAREG